MSNGLTRREFVKAAGQAVAATSAMGLAPSRAEAQGGRRRYAIVGTGERACGMWGRDLVKRYGDVVEIAGLCDINPKRVAAAKDIIGASCPTFTAFDDMCERVKPDAVIVTTVDAFHSGYIVKSLDRGIDVITEKPMVTDEAQCQAVLDAEKRNRRKIVVTFNARYPPEHQKIKEVLLGGEIGPVVAVDFNWYLDVRHGADYFRRWHRLKSRGGTLLVHKATHHFDLINWWLGADPIEVVADAGLRVYGKNGPFRSTHCRPCPHKSKCQFHYDMTADRTRMKLYAGCEDVDGYYRDGCVFREDVDIYDTMSALVKYSNGVTMTYSLNAYMPFEGYRVAFNGEKGRLEIRSYAAQPWPVEQETEIHLTKSFGKREVIPVSKAEGAHAGGDDRLRDLIFRKVDVPEHMRIPDSRAGAMSCLTGIAARKSAEEKRAIEIAELVRL
jgi:predicted dehydrogenase